MGKIVQNPSELKKLAPEDLNDQASLIREFLIESLSHTGGHIGSNLGVVELTLALHYFFNSPEDKIIFDVGHQCYVHKILTGRADKFDTLRQYQGLSGFIKACESEHDVWEAGHSSTSISAAAGYAFKRDLNDEKNHVIAVIGDGSLTNGMAIEALNHIVELNQNVIIIVNDNEMSISSNVGFIDHILKDLQVSTEYKNTKRRIHRILNKIPFGVSIAKLLSNIKRKVKLSISSTQNFFNIMGYNYIGPIDGHDINDLLDTFAEAIKIDGPKILHVKTEKGRGYKPASENKWHGVGPFDVKSGEPKKTKDGLSYSALVANHLANEMEIDENIVVITPAMIGGSELELINSKFPKRITDTGIAEEHALTFAAALAVANVKPFVAIYSTFLQRSYDQVFHDIARINANVVIGIDRAGLVGEDGETHQGIYDISFLSHMPNMTIVQGKNGEETCQLLDYAFKEHQGPIAIRYPRGGNFSREILSKNLTPILDQHWVVEKSATQNYIITYGELVDECLRVFANEDIGVINARFIKPLDLSNIMMDNHYIVIEEHTSIGSLYSLITNELKHHHIDAINLNSEFVEHGSVNILREIYNLQGKNLYKKVVEIFNGKN